MIMGGGGDAAAGMREMRKANNASFGKSEGKKQLRTPRCRWKGNIDRALEAIWFSFISTAYGPVEGSCEHSNVPSGFTECGEFLQSFSEY
jgi:hypothetical protein